TAAKITADRTNHVRSRSRLAWRAVDKNAAGLTSVAHDLEDHLPHSPAVSEDFGSLANPHSSGKRTCQKYLNAKRCNVERAIDGAVALPTRPVLALVLILNVRRA